MLADFYGTLARAVSWGDTHEAVFARHGLAYDEDAWTDRWVGGALDGEEHLEHSRDRARYQSWEHERLRSRATAVGVDAALVDPLVVDLYRASKDYTLAAYDEVAGVLGILRSRGLVVAVCSNWDWDLDEAVASVALDGLVDVVVTSARAGARKPHRRIFDLTLARCRLRPQECLFVGDTWEPDVVGPLAAGMRAVHLCRPDRMDGTEPPPLPPGSWRIGDLEGLLPLL